jgi:hypothetical protein
LSGFHVGAVAGTLVVVLLLPLSLAMDDSEHNNGGGSGGGGSPVAAAEAEAMAVVDDGDNVQWWRCWGHLMAAATLMAMFNGSGIVCQQGCSEMQMQQSNQGDDGSRGRHWTLAVGV